MQTLTIEAGEQMKENVSNREARNSGKPVSTESERSIFRVVNQTLFYFLLKMRLKEMGNHVTCDGNLALGGTKNIKIGDRCHFKKNVKLKTEGRGYIHIGENVEIGQNVTIISRNNVTIEDNTLIGDNVTITDILTKDSEISALNGTKPVYIGKDVWIGKNTDVRAGITVGHKATVSSNSVISRSIPPKVIAGGSPAIVIRDRSQSEENVDAENA